MVHALESSSLQVLLQSSEARGWERCSCCWMTSSTLRLYTHSPCIQLHDFGTQSCNPFAVYISRLASFSAVGWRIWHDACWVFARKLFWTKEHQALQPMLPLYFPWYVYIYMCVVFTCSIYAWDIYDRKKQIMKRFFHARHSCKDCMSISCQLDAITHHAHVLAESSHSTWSVCDAEGSNLIWVSSWWCHAWPDTDAPTGIEEVCVCSCSWRTMWRTRYQGRYSADSEEKATGRHLSCYPIWWHLSGEEHRRHQNLDGATRCHAVPHISIMLGI